MAWKCFDRDRRIQLAALVKAGHSKREMAAILGCHLSTIYRELKRGHCLQLDTHLRTYYTYSYELADIKSTQARSNCGVSLKITGNVALADFLRQRIVVDRYSPAAVSAELRCSDLGYLSKDTIYRYIHRHVLDDLHPRHLPEKGIRKHPRKSTFKIRDSLHKLGTSIDCRPAAVSDRETFGHWEMDTVIGKSKGTDQAFLVMTERLTSAELVFKLHTKEAASVVSVVDHLSRHCKFPEIFRSITMDNGTEFSRSDRLEFTKNGKRRTYCYYCHPYCSSERGINENANRLIRRWYPKGMSLASVTGSDCLRLSQWMNTYPRKRLGWKTPSEAFRMACAELNIEISPYLLQFLS